MKYFSILPMWQNPKFFDILLDLLLNKCFEVISYKQLINGTAALVLWKYESSHLLKLSAHCLTKPRYVQGIKHSEQNEVQHVCGGKNIIIRLLKVLTVKSK